MKAKITDLERADFFFLSSLLTKYVGLKYLIPNQSSVEPKNVAYNWRSMFTAPLTTMNDEWGKLQLNVGRLTKNN